jgi:hypothetical protein
MYTKKEEESQSLPPNRTGAAAIRAHRTEHKEREARACEFHCRQVFKIESSSPTISSNDRSILRNTIEKLRVCFYQS